jgi:hypothetical protein
MTRKDIEEQIKLANEATVLAKADQLEKEVAIGLQAEANRSAVLAWAANKNNPASKNYVGNTGLGSQGGKQGQKEETGDSEEDSKPLTTSSAKAIVSKVGNLGSLGAFGGSALGTQASNILSGATAKSTIATAKTKKETAGNKLQTLLMQGGLDGITATTLKNSILTNGIAANKVNIDKVRSGMNKTLRGELDAALAKVESANKEIETASSSGFAESEKVKLFSSLPIDVQNAFTELKKIRIDIAPLALALTNARNDLKAFQQTAGTDVNEYTDGKGGEKEQYKTITSNISKAFKALNEFDAPAKTVWDSLSKAGYSLSTRKLFAGYADGGMVMPRYMSIGGQAMGTDTVPAMLTPGEFIVSQPAVEDFGINNLKAINNGTYGGNSVYNYSVNVNAGSNASADDIARAVMNKINEVDARRVRGNNF